MSDRTKDILVKRSAQISNAAEILAAQTSDWQVIQAYVAGRLLDLQLTEVQTKKLERYQFAYNQLVSGKYTEQEVCEMIEATYQISCTQAMHDIRDSKEIFASSANLNKMFELKTQLQLNQQWTQMAIAAGDLRAAAQFDKNRAKLISMIPDVEDSAAEDFLPRTNVFTFDPSLLGYEQFTKAEVEALMKDIQNRYPGELDIDLLNFDEAEIVEE